nr:ribonuclease HI [Magnetococcus marinus]
MPQQTPTLSQRIEALQARMERATAELLTVGKEVQQLLLEAKASCPPSEPAQAEASLLNPPALPPTLNAPLPCLAPDMEIILYTDGACSGNPGPGGWGVHGRYGEQMADQMGWAPQTTNNRMEMLAAIHALEPLPEGSRVKIITDSAYVKDGITKWIHGWKVRGWKKSDGNTVLNVDLWKRLDAARQNRDVTWQWIKGHAGHAGNEQADRLARNAITQGQAGALEPDSAG